MQSDYNRLKIHTHIRPEAADAAPETHQEAVCSAEEQQREPEKKWPEFRANRSRYRKARRRPGQEREKKTEERLTSGERLVRNTALACALLLSVMALKNVDQPWSRQATEGIRQAMTMRVDWDDTLGRLSFVRALVPDTALVFFNMGGSVLLNRPVSGQISHEYTQQQPWLEYECSEAQPVCSVAAGRVAAAGQGAGDSWSVLITDQEGSEAVYGYLADVCVQVGQEIEAGQQIGTTADTPEARLYFELREDGEPVNPSDRMR